MSKIKAYMNVLNNTIDLIERELDNSESKKEESLLGYPLQYCPDELIYKFLDAEEDSDSLIDVPSYLSCQEELRRREFFGIAIKNTEKINKKEKK